MPSRSIGWRESRERDARIRNRFIACAVGLSLAIVPSIIYALLTRG